jgi:predicted nucleic acid binding AN1-type Zn finger protein
MSSNSFHDIPLLSPEFLERLLRQVDAPNVAPTESRADDALSQSLPVEPPKPQTRCPVCRHKLQLSDMACRCGKRHCSTHRLPELHACTYDHKAHDRRVLESQVVRCIADKLGEERL